MSALEALPNIGPVLARRLRRSGIADAEAFLALGDAAAFSRLRAELPDEACLSTRYALAGAARGVRWHALDPALRRQLAAEARARR